MRKYIKRSSQDFLNKDLILLGFMGIGIFLLIYPIILLILLIITILIVFCKFEFDKSLYNKAISIIEIHAKELAIKRNQLMTKSPYGIMNRDLWIKEKDFFIEKVISPSVRVYNSRLRKKINLAIDEMVSETTSEKEYSNLLTPIEYEAFVAQVLEKCGWTARLTKGSGDQGTDIIAQKKGIRISLQCKLYSGKVGNAAVQEVIAGKEFEKAQYAVVVSNAQYTKAAFQLASAAGVFLLHHDELVDLESKIFNTSISSI